MLPRITRKVHASCSTSVKDHSESILMKKCLYDYFDSYPPNNKDGNSVKLHPSLRPLSLAGLVVSSIFLDQLLKHRHLNNYYLILITFLDPIEPSISIKIRYSWAIEFRSLQRAQFLIIGIRHIYFLICFIP